ncbi:MAG TPA: hypothetical protein VHP32_11135 [Ignavibacteria bacterium]|nr:hypothetical protein [Ignavibacteria bacterium]
MKKIIAIVLFLFLCGSANAQFINKFSIYGGVISGWHIPKVDELNVELRKAGLPDLPTSGYFILGGGGAMDVPKVNWLRVGGFGASLSKTVKTVTPDNITKQVVYQMGMGGLSLEYIKPLSKRIDFTAGANLTTGELTLKIYQHNPNFGSFTTLWNEFVNSSSTQNFSQTINQRFYSVQPKVGFGFLLTDLLYTKINAGYMFTANDGWVAENGADVTGVPSGIKADGFTFDLSLNVGLFFK